jgi:hypothetical protein
MNAISAMRRGVRGAGARRLAGSPEIAPVQDYRGVLDSQAGAEWVSGTSAIVHYQFRAVPSADEVEVTLPLPDIENLWFE